jgi:hypothetical protein
MARTCRLAALRPNVIRAPRRSSAAVRAASMPTMHARKGFSSLAVITTATLVITECAQTSPPSPSPSVPTGTPIASSSLGASSPTPQPSEAPTLAADTVARVIVDGLRVREDAGLDAKVVGRLTRDDQVFVTDQRVEASGLSWLGVQGSWLDDDQFAFGFVAESDASGPFLEPVEIECPAVPVDIAGLAAMKPWAGLVCFGSEPLTLTGYDDPENYGFGGLCNCVATPEWLNHPFAYWRLSPSETEQHPWLVMRLRPRATDMWPADPGKTLTIVGHYDDPASSRCRFGHPDPSLQPDVPVTYEDATGVILMCREQFVVTEVVVAEGT